MNTPIPRDANPRESIFQGRMADTPRPVGVPFQGFRNLSGMSEATRYGILLFLLWSPEHELSEEQVLWIVYRARKLSEAELLKSGRLFEKLASNEISRQGLKREIAETYSRVPRLYPKQIPEKRRIGVGYRDKGALRPLHRSRALGERVFWDEDILYLLPLDYEAVGRWISADEVLNLVQMDHLNLALSTIQSMMTEPVKFSRSSVNLVRLE